MSLPTHQDKQHDCVGLHVEELKLWLDAPYRLAAYEAEDPEWGAALRTIERLLQTIDDHISLGTLNSIPDAQAMELVQAFDCTLFDNTILNLVDDIEFAWLTGLDDNEDDEWELQMGWTQAKSTGTLLRIHAFQHHDAVEVFGTFLHEMVHLFLDHCALYEGLEEEGSDEEALRVYRKHDGEGHAYYFQKLARAVEDRACQVLDLDGIDLSRLTAVHVECRETRAVPSLAFFEQMFGNSKWECPETARAEVIDELQKRAAGWTETVEEVEQGGRAYGAQLRPKSG